MSEVKKIELSMNADFVINTIILSIVLTMIGFSIHEHFHPPPEVVQHYVCDETVFRQDDGTIIEIKGQLTKPKPEVVK